MKSEIEDYSVSITQNTYIQNQDHYRTRQMANDSSTSSLFAFIFMDFIFTVPCIVTLY